jgi:hypothetical protein
MSTCARSDAEQGGFSAVGRIASTHACCTQDIQLTHGVHEAHLGRATTAESAPSVRIGAHAS